MSATPTSIVIPLEMPREAPFTIPFDEARAVKPRSPEEEKKALADAFVATLGLMAKLLSRYTNEVDVLPTQQIDVLVEEQRAPSFFWRLFFRGKTPPRRFTTQSTTAWVACVGAIRTVQTAVCIDVEDGTPYASLHISHRGIAGHVELTDPFLRGLTVGELKKLNSAARDHYQYGDALLHESLHDRWKCDTPSC